MPRKRLKYNYQDIILREDSVIRGKIILFRCRETNLSLLGDSLSNLTVVLPVRPGAGTFNMILRKASEEFVFLGFLQLQQIQLFVVDAVLLSEFLKWYRFIRRSIDLDTSITRMSQVLWGKCTYLHVIIN